MQILCHNWNYCQKKSAGQGICSTHLYFLMWVVVYLFCSVLAKWSAAFSSSVLGLSQHSFSRSHLQVAMLVIMVTIVIMVVVILIITMVMIVIVVVMISIITMWSWSFIMMCSTGLTTGMPLLPSYSLLSEVSIINITIFSLVPLLTCNTSRSPSSDWKDL